MDAPSLQPVPIVCCRLRSKGAGVVYGDPVRWQNGFYPSAVFWCLRTADAIGPDDGFVHPHVCIRGRECFANGKQQIEGAPAGC